MSKPAIENLTNLQQLIAQHPSVTLTHSSLLYPQASGTGLPLLKVATPLCTAVIALQGAHLLAFQPQDGAPLLWLSPHCDFTPGTALRGGIPLCLPWFGVNQQDPSKPKHGFARNRDWQLANIQSHDDGRLELEFLLVSEASELFPFDFSVELRLSLGTQLKLELTINNTDEQSFDCSWVMHNYFPVADLQKVRVKGLTGRDYKDNFENFARKHQVEDLQFPGPVDRVFAAIDNSLEIINNPNIIIRHHNCPSVVTWNPGAEAAANIADIGAGEEQHFVCVERGAVLEEYWHLPAGTSQTAWMEIYQG